MMRLLGLVLATLAAWLMPVASVAVVLPGNDRVVPIDTYDYLARSASSDLTTTERGSLSDVYDDNARDGVDPRSRGTLARPQAPAAWTPPALGLGRSIGRASHNRALQAEIAGLPRGATGIRVNQQQVNAAGQRVGINRPDLQYTLNGQRYYVEYEGLANPRGALHEARILSNDPGANFILRIVP